MKTEGRRGDKGGQKWKNLSAKCSSSPEREKEEESGVLHKRPFCLLSAH